MGNHEVTSPSAAGLPIGRLGRGGRGEEGLETGRGLEERNRLIGPEWGWGYVNFAAESGTVPSLPLCRLWKFFGATAWTLLEQLLGVSERRGKRWGADDSGRDGGNSKVSLCEQWSCLRLCWQRAKSFHTYLAGEIL